MEKDKEEIQVNSLEEIIELVKEEQTDFIIHVSFGEEVCVGEER